MRRQYFIAILGMILFAGAAQAADLGLSASIIDFGTIREGPPATKTVILTNNGIQPMSIANATAS